MAQRPDNPMARLAEWSSKVIFEVVAPENEQYVGRAIGEIATELGRSPFDVLCDIALADELNTTFGNPAPVPTEEDWVARKEIWSDPRALIGGSDAGAHLDLLASFNYATVFLADAVREHSILSLEEAVRMITDAPARLYGLKDRGRVAEGGYADLVVLDPATVRTQDVAMRFDLPGGAGRLYAEADGIEHVFVNGKQIVAGGKLTESRSGTLLRAGRDSA
jgi:N-acyl-D-aspartate/D-glutamate deacylase